jgi:hypothetical protein
VEVGRWTDRDRKVHVLFCKRVMGMPDTTANSVCVCEKAGKNK